MADKLNGDFDDLRGLTIDCSLII